MSRNIREFLIGFNITNIGTIIETEDKIICKVEQNKLYNLIYTLGGWPLTISDEELANVYLNKPIYYIFDGIIFDKSLRINMKGDRANIIFKNCTFVEEIYLENCIDVEFENNTYKNEFSYYSNKKCFLFVDGIRKLTFRNDNFINSADADRVESFRLVNMPIKFGINVTNAREVEFIDTKVEANFPTAINADRIRLDNSMLEGVEFGLSAKTIENKDSTIKATDGVIIDNQECDFIGTIESPIIFYNGEDVTNYSSQTTLISKDQVARRQMGVSLIDTLHKVKDGALQRITTSVGDIYGIKPNTRKRVQQK